MDLASLRDNLLADSYPTLQAFEAHLNSIWINCETYNTLHRNTAIIKIAKRF